MNNNIATYISFVLTAAILAGAVVLVGNWWKTTTEQTIKHEAVQGCLSIGLEEYSNQAQRSRAVTFNKQAYEFCMDEKGY